MAYFSLLVFYSCYNLFIKNMKHIGWKILGIFMLIWLFWYFTGGPKRTDNIKPYVKYDYNTNTINNSNIDLQTGGKDLLPINTIDNVKN